MKLITENSEGELIFHIPEIMTFGKSLNRIQFQHTSLIVEGKIKSPTKRSEEKHLESLEYFSVNSEEGQWDQSYDKKLQALIKRWDRVATNIKQSLEKYYRTVYENYREHLLPSEEDEVILPKVSDGFSLGDYFTIHSLFFTEESTHIGISGECSWDEEHGWGCVIKGSKVVDIGHSDVSFQPSDQVVEYVDPFVPFSDKALYKIQIPEEGLKYNQKVTKATKDYLQKLALYSVFGTMPGIFVLLLKEFTNIRCKSAFSYSLRELEASYKVTLNLDQTLKNLLKFNRSGRKEQVMMKRIYKTCYDKGTIPKENYDNFVMQTKHDIAVPQEQWDIVCICVNGKDYCAH